MTQIVGTHGSCVRPTSNSTDGPQRKNIRAEFHDYSGGDYFVTICTRDKGHYFGKIRFGSGVNDDEMVFTEIGQYCHEQLESLPSHYPYVEVPMFVVMPNHIHAIICIDAGDRTHEPCVPTIRTALSVVVGGLKRAVTLYARRNNIEFGWQNRYHDHIIRGATDGNKIADYIENNVARWASDCYHS